MSSEIKWVEVNETRRSYFFANNDELHINNVKRVEVRPSGKHRIETTDGKKFFVAPGWLWMEIETPEWTF